MRKSIIIILHYHNLVGKIEELMKKYLMLNNNILNKVLDKVKEVIDIEKFDHVKIVIDADDKIPTDITLKNFMILITCTIKNDGKFYLKVF